MSKFELNGNNGYAPPAQDWPSNQPCEQREILWPCTVVDPEADYPPITKLSLGHIDPSTGGKVIMYSTPNGTDDGAAFYEKFGLNKQPDDVNWETVELSITEPQPGDIVLIDTDGVLSDGDEQVLRQVLRSEPTRVLVVGDCHASRRMRSRIAEMGAVVLGVGLDSLSAREMMSASIARAVKAWSFSNQFPAEFRFTDLHYKLSHEATMLKDKRQQQSRKAHFLMHEKKRVARGRSHAKQKHKGMQRYA